MSFFLLEIHTPLKEMFLKSSIGVCGIQIKLTNLCSCINIFHNGIDHNFSVIASLVYVKFSVFAANFYAPNTDLYEEKNYTFK